MQFPHILQLRHRPASSIACSLVKPRHASLNVLHRVGRRQRRHAPSHLPRQPGEVASGSIRSVSFCDFSSFRNVLSLQVLVYRLRGTKSHGYGFCLPCRELPQHHRPQRHRAGWSPVYRRSLEPPLPALLRVSAPFSIGDIRGLADRDDHRISDHAEFTGPHLSLRVHVIRPCSVKRIDSTLLKSTRSLRLPGRTVNCCGASALWILTPSLLRGLDFPRPGGHARPGFQTGRMHLRGTQAKRGACSIHGHGAATDHQDIAPERKPFWSAWLGAKHQSREHLSGVLFRVFSVLRFSALRLPAESPRSPDP